ncbi:phosphonopyruvate decarboxylase [Neptunomonas qingdaonensis]|uniref:Phosphonopyruvate decarboxylase n=1 Tax=Neptunomonas qingdaonensis TaxID=1045558 RepID=A0A1I2UUD6_9GAMM|nr:phosphonopyruvate decarboxylase [Neptunomonas qingdaonensis]SFG78556.1 phosphonopyruvate decarboxylase [Neptunomonas qingdaonensis]
MIAPKHFVDSLAKQGIDYYAGVPDSLLKDFCAYVDDHGASGKHIITANEGNAVGLAAGYHMATGKCPLVYLQNSGLGNIINPLTSIADKEVYSIPMLLVIGWRGEPDVKDEPQHVKQGRITAEQLDLLEIPYKIVDESCDAEELAAWAKGTLEQTSAPVAFLVKKGAFSTYKSQRKVTMGSSLGRETALNALLPLIGDACVVSTTGKTSREVFELRAQRNEAQRDFLTVGGMGHTLSIGLGVAMGQPDKQVVCIDGDGSVLMHLGALPIVGSIAPSNLVHVLLNNAAHESVGGQPTVADTTDFKAIAFASGYAAYAIASTLEGLTNAWHELAAQNGPVMLEVRIANGSRDDLGRPTSTPIENKQAFMNWVAR